MSEKLLLGFEEEVLYGLWSDSGTDCQLEELFISAKGTHHGSIEREQCK